VTAAGSGAGAPRHGSSTRVHSGVTSGALPLLKLLPRLERSAATPFALTARYGPKIRDTMPWRMDGVCSSTKKSKMGCDGGESVRTPVSTAPGSVTVAWAARSRLGQGAHQPRGQRALLPYVSTPLFLHTILQEAQPPGRAWGPQHIETSLLSRESPGSKQARQFQMCAHTCSEMMSAASISAVSDLVGPAGGYRGGELVRLMGTRGRR
jgi:hypothetical protein